MLSLDQLAQQTVDRIALIPKNSGLQGQLSRVEVGSRTQGLSPIRVRGEDVPFLASEIARSGRDVVAFTGDDLLEEWLLAGNVLHERLRRGRVAWHDPLAMFGAPALCLIGRSPDVLLEDRPLRIACCSRYLRQTQRYVNAMRRSDVPIGITAISGSVEACIASDLCDLIVDIVVTGKTLACAGLRVLRVIATSDLAVLETQ